MLFYICTSFQCTIIILIIISKSFYIIYNIIPGIDTYRNELTSIDDFAEEIFSSEKVLRWAIPSSISKLMLALNDSLICTPSNCH